MDILKDIALSLVVGRKLSGERGLTKTENTNIAEQYVNWLPTNVISGVFHWLEKNTMLDKTELELEIMVAICIGDRPDLELAFPQFRLCNPEYSYRRFNIEFVTIPPTKTNNGSIEIHLDEIDITENSSNLIREISQRLYLNMLQDNRVCELISDQSAALRKHNKGFLGYGAKLPKRRMSVSIPTEVIEDVFVDDEKNSNCKHPRPFYLRYCARNGARILDRPQKK